MNWRSRRRSGLSCVRLEGRDAPAVFPVGPEFRVNDVVNSTAAMPAIAVAANGDFTVAWHAENVDGDELAVMARRYSSTGAALSGDFQVNTYTNGAQQNPAIASDAAGNVTIVWGSASVQDGSREGVYLRRYNAAGTPISGEIQVNQFTLNVQGNPAIAMDSDGDFVVAWESNYQDGDGYAIYARKYNSAGVAVTSEFQVNQTSFGDQQNARVAMDADGDFAVVWQGPDAGGYGVYGRRYNSSGTPLGGEFQVNQTSANDQLNPVVALTALGNLTVAWQSEAQDSGTTGIYARRYDSGGAALSNEFRVNTYAPGSQTAPTIASSASGVVTICWRSTGQDGDSGGVYGQRIAANGVLVGAEIPINFTTAGNQTDPAIGSNDLGEFAVTWTGVASPVSGIIAQRYAPPPAPQATIHVDDGSGQRSSVRYLVLQFNTIVDIGPGGIQLSGPLGNVGLSIDTSSSTAVATVAKVTFSGPSSTVTGLVNGQYTLTLTSALITNVEGVGYDGNADGLPGPSGVFSFHRWYGDADGDGDVDNADFNILRSQFGSNAGEPGFKYWLDFDGDGSISVLDLNQFRVWFGTNI